MTSSHLPKTLENNKASKSLHGNKYQWNILSAPWYKIPNLLFSMNKLSLIGR